MGDRSSIEWTDASWNPIGAFDRVTGRRGWFCTKVSEGCRNCYAESFNRFRGNGYEYTAQNLSNVRFELVNLDQPFRWKRPRRIFVNSMTDLFGDFVSDEDIAEIFKVMYKSPRHIFQVLTKRPERMLDWISRSAFLSNDPLPNVWLGISAEDQKSANDRIPLLLQTPAALRWISAEPLLGPIDLQKTLWNYVPESVASQFAAMVDDKTSSLRIVYGLDWVIVGGESGPGARPMHPEWARSIRDQCVASDVAFFFKQWGKLFPVGQVADGDEVLPGTAVYTQDGERILPDCCGNDYDVEAGDKAIRFKPMSKKAAGRSLDGREWNEYPAIMEVAAT